MRRVLASIWQRNPKTWKVEGRQSQCNTSKIFLGLNRQCQPLPSQDVLAPSTVSSYRPARQDPWNLRKNLADFTKNSKKSFI